MKLGTKNSLVRDLYRKYLFYFLRKRYHAVDKPFTCERCFKTFSDLSYLKAHEERIHIDDGATTADAKEKYGDNTEYQNYKQEEAVNGNVAVKDTVKEVVNAQSHGTVVNNPHIGIIKGF